MSMRWIVPSLIAACASPVFAQSTAILSGKPEADAAYARALFDRGQAEMAESVCTLLTSGGRLPAPVELEIQSILFDVRAALVKRTTDLAKRKDALKQILADKEAFIKQHEGKPQAELAAATLGDNYQQLGDTLKALIEKETEPAVVADYQAEGQKVYGDAEERLKLRIEELTKAVKAYEETEPEEDDPKLAALTGQWMTVRFNLANTLLAHAQLYRKDEFQRKNLLDQALELMDMFMLDFASQDSTLVWNGVVLQGQILKELGRHDEALDTWAGMAKDLKEIFPVSSKGVYELSPLACDLVSVAHLQQMLLLSEIKREAEGIVLATDFFAKCKGAYESHAGLAILYQMGLMQLALNDAAGAGMTANKLVELDGNGPWGNNGRDLLNKLIGKDGGSIDSSQLLNLARTQVSRGNISRALELCRQAVTNARGDKAQDDTGFNALLLMGDIFRQRGWHPEASVAYDEASTRYAAHPEAAEAVYRSLQCFQTINDVEKRPYYKKKIEERMRALASKYSTHARASYALIIEGRGYDGDNEYTKAAETYLKVQPSAQSYWEAQISAANSYYLHARALSKDAAKKAEAKPFLDQAMAMLAKAAAEIEPKIEDNFDVAAQQRMAGQAFRARITLAQIQLDELVNQPAKTLETLNGLDENKRYNGDPDNIAKIWNLRIQAYNKQGKIEEAAKLLDGLITKSPDSPAIASAAGAVAREFDRRAAEASDKKDDKTAHELWKKATRYYRLSGTALVKSGGAGRASELSQVAERLFVLGLIANDVEGDSFLGWRAPRSADLDNFKVSSDLYEASLAQAPSRKGQINSARVHGFLGQWAAAADTYARFFDNITLVDSATGRFLNETLADTDLQKLGLLQSYVEWGVCEARAGKQESDSERYARALKIFSNVAKNPGAVVIDTKLWWQFKHDQVQVLVHKGDYKEAGIQLRDAERNTQSLGKPAGLENEFKTLKTEIEKHSFGKQGVLAPPAPAPAQPK